MVVEYLTFTVDPADQQGWIDADAQIWTSFLRRQPGFVAKQVWLDRRDPTLVHTVITWADELSWKAVPVDELAIVDEQMGSWRRPFTEQVFDVIRSD